MTPYKRLQLAAARPFVARPPLCLGAKPSPDNQMIAKLETAFGGPLRISENSQRSVARIGRPRTAEGRTASIEHVFSN
jgi:hypothetical protein